MQELYSGHKQLQKPYHELANIALTNDIQIISYLSVKLAAIIWVRDTVSYRINPLYIIL